MCVAYDFVALSDAVAKELSGGAILHALRIPMLGHDRRGEDGREQIPFSLQIRVLQRRWCALEEISIVSARLLAIVDMKLRSFM